jgi:hypothetical protein
MKSVTTIRKVIVPLLAVVVIGGGLALMFTGRAAELGQWRDITVKVTVPNVPATAELEMGPGDVIYTDPAAMQAGVVEEVITSPMLVVNPDAAGALQVSPNPLLREVTVVFSTKGRQTAEIIATGNQVIQVGQMFTVFTKTAQLRGTIIDIDVD